jgi:cytochrome c5
MANRTLAAAFALVPALAVPVASRAAQPPFALKSETVELPASNRTFPSGPGVETVSASCVICHSPGMVLNQPALTRAAWEAEVRKMINVYKAPIPDADVAPIIAYLAQIKAAN